MNEPQTAAEIMAGYKAARARILAAGLAHERRAARRKPINTPAITPNPATLTPLLIIETVAEVINIPVPYMLDYTSHSPPSIARALAAYFMRDRLDMTHLSIGAFLGGRDKATIKYAIVKIQRNIGHYAAWMKAIAKRLPY